MRKSILFFVFIAFSIVCTAQNQVITINGDTINDQVAGLYWRKLEFKNSNLKLDIMEVKEISGDIPESRLKMMLKLNKNIIVNEEPQQNNYIEGMYGKNPLKPDERYIYIPQVNYIILHPTGAHLRSAGNYYLAGTALGGVAGLLSLVSITNDSKELRTAAFGVTLSAAICAIIGHTKLVQAGKSFTKESITLEPAQSGLGLAINF